ncbi:MAG: PASTA domain-containing protein [Candidatus Neomarinimicrobiota bacterium]
MNNFLRYIIAIGVIIAFLVILFEIVLMPLYVRHNQSRYLMDITYKSLMDATEILELEGFQIIVSDTVYTNDLAPNTVVDQFPKPSMRVKSGRTVRLKISQEDKLVEVPKLIGQSRRSAEILLQQAGLVIDTVYTEYNPDFPQGTVAWQSPRGGDLLKRGLGVHITVSEGMSPNYFQVPNLFGLSKDRAGSELEKAGLLLGKIYYQQNIDLVPYTVLDQSIPEGTVLDKSVDIDITVSVLDMQDIFNQIMDKP